VSADTGIRGFFHSLSRRPGRAWPEGVVHHGARALILIAIAALTTFLFPVSPAPDFPVVEKGMVLDHDIIADVDFQVPRPEAELQRERDQVAAAVTPIFRYDSTAIDTMRARVGSFLDRLDAAFDGNPAEPVVEQRLRDALGAVSLQARPDVITLLRSRQNRSALRSSLEATIERDVQAGVLRGADLQNSVAGQVRIIRNGNDELVARDTVPTLEKLRENASRNLPANSPAGLVELQQLVLSHFAQPSLRYDRMLTDASRQAARNAVQTFRVEVVAGERIIDAHVRIDEDDIAKLQAYEARLAALGRLDAGRTRFIRTAGSITLNVLLLAVFAVMMLLYRPQVYERFPSILVLAAVSLVAIVPAAFIARNTWPVAVIPIAFPALVVAMLWDGRMALALALVLSVLLTAQSPLGELSARILLIGAGSAAALSVRVVHRRTHGLLLGSIVALAYFAATFAVGLLLTWPPVMIATTALWGGVNGIICALIAVGLMPVFETWTGITTEMTLLELGDLNGKVLKRLSLEASGTYAHCVNVAHLAEAAAREIGANPLLARVGAYYHDIGKMAAPQYFVENQIGGRNPHDRITPEESVAIIRGHVTEGQRMAIEAKLPDCVRDFIPEHHGTQLIGFFYEKAKERAGGDDLDPADYSYPGPNPRSRETAILMLADSVESAAKVLEDPSPASIAAMVERIVQGKINRNQLDDSPVTFRDLIRIKQAFVQVLGGMYHHRIDYPASAIGLSAPATPEPQAQARS
jgi:cyclic-di-AMP phosphodiesterase PgpH